MFSTNTRRYLVLILAFIAVIAHHQFAYIGHYGYDDLNYAKNAVDLNNGTADYSDHFTFRFSLVYLTAISYKLFGINDFSSSLPPMGITFLILFTIFYILRKKPVGIIALGLGLTLLNQWFLFYTDKLMPDIYVALAVIFSLFVIYRYKFESDRSKPWLYAILLSAGLLFGFISKGTIVLIVPLLLYIFIVDVFLKRDIKFWLFFVLSGIVLLAVYLLFIKYLTGNVMQRFDALYGNSYLNRCSYDKQSITLLFERIAYQLYSMFIKTGLITGMAISIAFFFQKNSKKIFCFDTAFSFFPVSTLLLFLSANFMSISPISYVPMCIDPRHYLFLVPVAAIPASEILYSFFKERKYAIQLLLVFLFLSVISFFMEGNSFWGIYFPLFILFAFSYLFYNRIKSKNIFVYGVIAVLSVYPMNMVKYARTIKYTAQRDFVYEHFIDTNKSGYVICNDVQKRLGDFYQGFDSNSPITFLSYENFRIDTLKKDNEIYLLLNPYTRFLSQLNLKDLPVYARYPNDYGSPVSGNKELKMEVYNISGLTNPFAEKNRLLYSFNGFEKDVLFWRQNQKNISDKIKYEGLNSSAVGEYSATFEYPLDSLFTPSINNILITVKMQCFFSKPTKALLVVQIKSKEGKGMWKSFEINKYLKAYSNWWPIKHEIIVDAKEVSKGDKLKIYVWNPEKDKAYLDNFEISIYRISPNRN